MQRSARAWLRLGIFALAAGLPTSCLLTSSFDDLTGGPIGADGGEDGSVTVAAVASSGAGGAGTSASSSTGMGGDQLFPSPTSVVLDDFNRPDGPLGLQWLIDNPAASTVANHQLASAAGDPGVILWPASFGANQEAFITFKKINPNDFEIELILKSQADGGECEALELAYHDGVELALYSCSGGMGTMIGKSVPITFADGDQLGGRAFADGKVQAFKNGVLVGAWDASGWADHAKAGRIGLGTYGLTAPHAFDDFGGGTLP